MGKKSGPTVRRTTLLDSGMMRSISFGGRTGLWTKPAVRERVERRHEFGIDRVNRGNV